MSDDPTLAMEVALELMLPKEKSYGPKTFRHDNPHLEHDKADRPHNPVLGGNKRAHGGDVARFENLHVWGYTAHDRESPIGQVVRRLNVNPRWKIRFSVGPDTPHHPMQASAIWTKEAMVQPNAVVCPQELGKTQACGTCALCWAEPMADTRILFLGHGGRGPRKKGPQS